DKYVGEYKGGKKHGKGTFTYGEGKYEGQKYAGEWKADKRNGKGTFTWQNPWEQYVGEWKDNMMHGQGTYKKADGTGKKGLWANNKFLRE
ncbi:MAG: hypothetical protein ACKVJA_05295, partial [Flavobacteriales bacterium]